MTLAKSLLLASAAGLVAAAGAQAADLPAKKSAPADFVRICTLHGPGFFYIPGSDTCIRIGGRARFEYVGGNAFNKSSDTSSFNATGRLSLDARTATDWGLLRAYFRTELSRNTGNNYFGSGSGARGGTKFGYGGGAVSASGFPSFAAQDSAGNRVQTGVSISAAFVQWGGLTAGRIQSFFDFYADNDTWFGVTDSDVITQALAYTYTFGSGFSATLAIEDPKERQKYPIAGTASVSAGGIDPSSATSNFTINYPFSSSPYSSTYVSSISYTQRENIPDVVGVLRVDQGWGSAQLSGAYHRIETEGSTVTNLTLSNTGASYVVNPLVPSVSGGYGTLHGNSFAVQGGVKINLPFIATGDTLYLQAAYSKGNLSYVNSGFPASWTGQANSIGGTTFSTYDAVVGPSGKITLTPAFSALASFEHYWTPTIRQGLFGGLEHISYGSSIRTAAGYAQGAACPTCLGTITTANGAYYNPYSNQYVGGTQYNLGTNLIWSPVKDLDIGVEVFYFRNQMAHQEWDVNKGNGTLTKSDDAFLYRLRVSRDF